MTTAAARLLAVTSSTGVISAAVGTVGPDGVSVLSEATYETERRHAEEIGPLIQKLLADAGLPIGDLDTLVADRGPGRFTGLRVGLATVKTLAYALDIPVIGLTSLRILSAIPAAVNHDEYRKQAAETVTAVIDARRNEVFQQTFSNGQPVASPVVGPAGVLAKTAAGIVVGDGLDRYFDLYRSASPAVHDKPASFPVDGVGVDAMTMLTLAADRDPQSGSTLEPLYLRDPDVNPNVKTRPRA